MNHLILTQTIRQQAGYFDTRLNELYESFLDTRDRAESHILASQIEELKRAKK